MVPGGTLIVGARADDELALLEGVAADPARQARMLTGAEVGEAVPIPTAAVIAGFHGALDLRVDPRSAVAGLAALLRGRSKRPSYWAHRMSTTSSRESCTPPS